MNQDTSQSEKSSKTVPTDTVTVLLVEDDAHVRTLIHAMLQKLGYGVLVADDAYEARSILKANALEINLLLSDIVMPGLNGKNLCDFVAPNFPHIKILLMSGYSGDILTDYHAIRDNVRVLHKPFSYEELRRSICDTLEAD